MSGPARVIIVGGGYTGLVAARELSRRAGTLVTLLERSAYLGGLAGGFSVQGTHLEKAYHHLFRTDVDILGLIEELGLQDQLMWCPSSMGIYVNGRVHPFNSPFDLLRFRPCGFFSRLRLGLVVLYLQKKRNWSGLVKQGAYTWMSRACGADAMRAMWEPLLRGKFDRHFDKVSMAWLWARIHIRANSRGQGAAVEQLAYLRGGFDGLTRKLESELLASGVRIEVGAEVQAIDGDARSVTINGRREAYDACIFTGPSGVLAALLPQQEKLLNYRRQLESVAYLGAICMVFVSEQDLKSPYWLNINEPDAPFLVCLQHTQLVDKSLYNSRHVYYLGAYKPPDHPAFAQSDDELSAQWWAYLKKIFPAFDPSMIVERHVFRFKHAQHVVDTDYEERIPDYRTPLAGLYLSNFSQIFPEDRGTNYAVREGRKIARLAREDLDSAIPSASRQWQQSSIS